MLGLNKPILLKAQRILYLQCTPRGDMALEMPSSSHTQNENTGRLKLKAMKIRKMYSYIMASHSAYLPQPSAAS